MDAWADGMSAAKRGIAMTGGITKHRICDVDKTCSLRLAESFLCAGMSALLLSIPRFYPQIWFLSFVALIPFLWRVVRIGFKDAIILGIMLALAYCFVMASLVFEIGPGAVLYRLCVFLVLFVLFAATVNKIAGRIGIHAIFIAILWLPLEYGLNRLAGIGQILTFPATDSGLILRVGALFGALMISFIFVLINILILILLREIIDALVSNAESNIERLRRFVSPVVETHHGTFKYSAASSRAPPLSAVFMS